MFCNVLLTDHTQFSLPFFYFLKFLIIIAIQSMVHHSFPRQRDEVSFSFRDEGYRNCKFYKHDKLTFACPFGHGLEQTDSGIGEDEFAVKDLTGHWNGRNT